VQDQVARELVDDFDQGYNPNDLKDLLLQLVEYDPSNSDDNTILTELLKEKIDNEGNPLIDDLKYYEENPEQLIISPILILSGSCVEGRHRLTVSLINSLKIRAYIL
jgi:hypothetical protein